MDLQNIFGLLEELFVDPIIFLGFVIVFRFDKLFDSVVSKNIAICKVFLSCPFSASVNFSSKTCLFSRASLPTSVDF